MAQEHDNQLEDIVDVIGLTETLTALANICYLKAEHLESNWQDSASAKTWTRDAATIEKIIAKLNN